MLCCVVCVVVVVVLFGGRGVFGVRVCSCVFVCVLRHAEKKREKPVCGFKNAFRVYIQNVPVYAGTTRTCVSTCARDASTHGDVLNLHTGSREEGGWSSPSFCLPRLVHVELSLARDVIQSYHGIFPIFKFENRSRTTCSRFLQSFALPDKVVQLQLS